MTRQVLTILILLPLVFTFSAFPSDQLDDADPDHPVQPIEPVQPLPEHAIYFQEALVSLQSQIDIIGNQTALNFAQLSHWLHSNITSLKHDLIKTSKTMITKKYLKDLGKKMKERVVSKVTSLVNSLMAKETADRIQNDAQLESYIIGNSSGPVIQDTPPRSPLTTAAGDSISNNTTPTPVNVATTIALLKSELANDLSDITYQVKNNFATLSTAIQGFQISESNLNATVNGHTNQINYLNGRQDDMYSYFSNKVAAVSNDLSGNLTVINQFLTNNVYGNNTVNPNTNYKLSRNTIAFSKGRVDPSNAKQLLIIVPHTVTFYNVPTVIVSLVADSGVALPAFTVAVQSVNTASATIVVALKDGQVSLVDPYSVVVFGFGN